MAQAQADLEEAVHVVDHAAHQEAAHQEAAEAVVALHTPAQVEVAETIFARMAVQDKGALIPVQ